MSRIIAFQDVAGTRERGRGVLPLHQAFIVKTGSHPYEAGAGKSGNVNNAGVACGQVVVRRGCTGNGSLRQFSRARTKLRTLVFECTRCSRWWCTDLEIKNTHHRYLFSRDIPYDSRTSLQFTTVYRVHSMYTRWYTYHVFVLPP